VGAPIVEKPVPESVAPFGLVVCATTLIFTPPVPCALSQPESGFPALPHGHDASAPSDASQKDVVEALAV
jgi:hypothetical protein